MRLQVPVMMGQLALFAGGWRQDAACWPGGGVWQYIDRVVNEVSRNCMAPRHLGTVVNEKSNKAALQAWAST
jgi:hypothetical protein